MYDLSEKVSPTKGSFVGGVAEAAMRYLYTCGMTAWYCARMAKMSGVGPAGR